MSKSPVIVLAVLECISVFFIVRLWRTNRKMSAGRRCFWSVVLLIPLFGWLFYGFIVTNAEAHSDLLTEYDDGSGGGGSSGSAPD